MGLVTLSRSFPGANSLSSMSQEFHQGIFSFSDGFDRSAGQENQHHIAQQSRRDKLRVHGFDPTGHPLVPIDEEGDQHGIYEPSGGANMLSEMFNYATPGPNAAAATDLLANQISLAANYRFPNRPTSTVAGFSGDWYGTNRKQDGDHGSHHIMQGLNVDSSAAMQLFLMPTQQHPRSPSPQPPTPTPSLHDHHQAFHTGVPFNDGPFRQGHVVERQGLSLSLASSQLQPFEMAAKAEEMRVRDGVLYFNEQQQQTQQQQLSSAMPLQHEHGQQQSQGQSQVQMGYGPMGVVNVLRNSKYARAAEELLEEFCSVGRGQLKSHRIGKHHASSSNPNPSGCGGGASSSAAGPSSSSKDLPPLSPAERFEYQRKKAKLLSMLDEVDRRYNHYCDQMQMVVNSFDSVMGFGAATPYTALAQRAMSRHFRCLKDAIAAQLKQTCELLGEDGGSSSGITKGETPRLRLLDQNLRQQRAFHQMGMTEQEAWRPQRGLPERSVTILRAWLFEHFLHPYPSDADKQLLARRTGLSRNQVSNWFINARVRLWKPMVEEMYQQESKEAAAAAAAASDERDQHQTTHSPTDQHHPHRPETNAPPESDPSQTHHRFSTSNNSLPAPTVVAAGNNSPAILAGAPTAMRFGATGDVSLTLGLRHAGNAAENSRFTVRDFGGC